MESFQGNVTVVTGAASGIGAALALACAREGSDVVLADIEDVEPVAREVRREGVKALAARTDVSDFASVASLADTVYREFGRVNLLCNNAGVVVFGPLVKMTREDWDWILGVNVNGVVNGILAFVPGMIAQEEEAHIVNTASGAGLVADGGTLPLGAYATTKFAVVGLSDALRAELEPYGIGVTTLCPGSVETGILETARYVESAAHLRPRTHGGPTPGREHVRRMRPADVARLVLEGIRAKQPYVMTHPESGRTGVEARQRRLLAAFDWAQGRPAR